MLEIRAVRVRISGRVHGVGFRAWTRGEAMRLGLSGWVRNLPGGDVEAVLSGVPDAVSAMLSLCRKGAPHSVVERMIETPADPLTGPFEIRRHGFP